MVGTMARVRDARVDDGTAITIKTKKKKTHVYCI